MALARYLASLTEHTSTMTEKNDMTEDDDSFDRYFRDYSEKQKEYLDKLDFEKLAEIRSKDLKDLTEGDLLAIGFQKVDHDEIENLYCYADLNGIKVYIEREGQSAALLGYQLRKIKDLYSTVELLDETLTKWRLKME
jgi:hypothetical protein